MTEALTRTISEAIAESDPARSNHQVTLAHYDLSQALEQVIGAEAGANFHSWAVWGSKKAGVTIRQEDLEQALYNATWVSSLVGFATGIMTAALVQAWLAFPIFSSYLILAGGLLGAITGALVGRQIARFSRQRAAVLILEGNHTVLEEIGGKTADFVGFYEQEHGSSEGLTRFFDTFRSGPSETGGQDLLRRAFQAYHEAAQATTEEQKQEACYFANCLAIVHEHIRLQPYISRSLPWIVRHCVTERMMHFDIAEMRLSVADDIPTATNARPTDVSHQGLYDFLYGEKGWLKEASGSPAASNWTSIKQRMRYILVLFRNFHLDSRVRSHPYSLEKVS